MEVVEVKIGQIWEDWDIRTRDSGPRRRIKILEIRDGRARVQSPRGMGPRTWIRVDRFKPTATGYKLVEDAPET